MYCSGESSSMEKLNVEFKARLENLDAVREKLRTLNPREVGTDRQRDTYFEVREGRLKLREGDIENALIFYRRADQATARDSHVQIASIPNAAELRAVLAAALPVRAVVEKRREIFFVGKTKIHLDRVENHGCFLEVEAPNASEAEFFFRFFELDAQTLEGRSYADFAAQGI